MSDHVASLYNVSKYKSIYKTFIGKNKNTDNQNNTEADFKLCIHTPNCCVPLLVVLQKLLQN